LWRAPFAGIRCAPALPKLTHTYLPSTTQAPTSGDTEENLSHEEQLRRERQRQMTVGITNFEWTTSTAPKRIMVVSQGNIFVGTCETDESSPKSQNIFHKIFDKASTGQKGGAIDPHFSPDGTKIAFVQDSEVFVLSVDAALSDAPAAPLQVTSGARGTGKTNGLADFIAQEEMDRYRGFWWSPDSQYIAFIEVDETHIPEYQIMHQGKEKLQSEVHRYPFAGADNARIRLGVVRIPADLGSQPDEAALRPQWLSLAGEEEDIYLARVDWLADGSVVAQVQNREQNISWLKQYRVDLPWSAAAQPGRVLLREKSKYWTNLHHNLRSFVHDAGEGAALWMLWTSEADGFMHIYLYSIPKAQDTAPSADDAVAKLENKLTWGNWIVESIVGVDAAGGVLYFTGTETSPLERHLYAVSLWKASVGSEPDIHRLTEEQGMHNIVMSDDCSHFVDGFSSLEVPPQDRLFAVPPPGGDAAASLVCLLHASDGSSGGQKPQLVSFKAADASTKLYGAVFRPDPTTFGPGPYKTIVYMYGGPHVQLVSRRWSLRAMGKVHLLTKAGFLVFICDNRGSNRRGADFEGAMKHNMGDEEVKDQVEGVKFLVSNKLSIPDKIGCFGWSYGGYMTCMCLARAPTVFAAGVAGAPVTHWDGYDTHYTERYMGTPQNNPLGYKVSSVMHHAKNIKGKLMLIHGLIDENVHFRHSARLINALIEGNVEYRLLLFPCERHSPRKPQDNAYLSSSVVQFFYRNL